MGERTLLIISAHADAAAREAVARGRWPGKDFLELARALDADLIDYGVVERSRLWRTSRRLIGTPATQALIAFSRRRHYTQILSDGEHIGLPLTFMLRFSRRRPRHVMIGHLIDTPGKRLAFRSLQPAKGFDVILVHSARQQQIAHERLHLDPAKVALVPYQADPAFWSPRRRPEGEAMICSAGLEYRDYPTLLAAAKGLPVRVVIAAASYWSRHRDLTEPSELPPNVEVTSLDYQALRDCYARARFVVIPLRNVENQAGITTILEAMAMGKAVVVTWTSGQRDVVRGRLCTSAGVGDTLQGGPEVFGLAGPLAEAETGLYVPAGDAAALGCAITHLLDHPDEALRMGAAGRRLVEEAMNLDQFVGRISAILRGEPSRAEQPARARTPALFPAPPGDGRA